MLQLISYRTNTRIFNALMFFVAFTFMLVWLPLLRCLFDGPSYSWGQSYFGMSFFSKGLSADYLLLVVFFVLSLFLFASFYWIKNRMVFYILLGWWWLHAFGNVLYDIIRNGDAMFHGDTLDVHISLSAIVIPMSILALILIVLVIRKDRKMPEVHIPWGRSNNLKAIILLGPIAIQAFLFATGEPHGLTDQIGVIIAIIQSYLFPIIFFPERDRATEAKPV